MTDPDRQRRRRRRSFATTCVVLMFGLVQPNRAVADPEANAPVPNPIEHVVVIYQENHSFDETLGYLCHSRPTPCDGYTGIVTLKGGERFKLRVSPDIVPGVGHFVKEQLEAIDGGKMDGWASVGGCHSNKHVCLTYYKPQQIPNLAALANAFTISDRTFEMADSPSWGGHIYVAASTLDGFTGDTPKYPKGVEHGRGWGCDSNRVALWIHNGISSKQPSCIPKPDGSGTFRPTKVPYVPTIFDRLEAQGGTWKIYGAPPPLPGGESPGYIWSICPTFANCIYTNQVNNLVPTVNVLDDAATGNLPDYSVLTPSGSSEEYVGAETSQHNFFSMMAGDNWIGDVVSAIENGPEWDSTAIFITYDDCGCFYDHVPPGVNPDGTLQGVRVPMVIISPYAKAGYTDSNHATFSSVLAFAEHTFGLAPLGPNDAVAYDYSDAFDFSQNPLPGIPLSDHPIPSKSSDFLEKLPPGFAEDDDPT